MITIRLLKKVLVFPSLICLLLLFTFVNPAVAQDTDSIISSNNKAEKCKCSFKYRKEKSFTYLSPRAVNRLVYSKVSGITTGGSTTNSIANYAAFDPLKASLATNFSAPIFTPVLKDNSKGKPSLLLSTSITADLLSDYSTVLFNNSKINSNVAIDLQIHLVPKVKSDRNFVFTGSGLLKYNQAKREAEYKYEQEVAKNSSSVKNVEISIAVMEIKRQENSNKIFFINDCIDELHAKIHTDSKFPDSITKYQTQLKKLKSDDLKMSYQLDSLKLISKYSGASRYDRVAAAKLKEKLNDLDANISAEGMRLKWWTFVGGIGRKDYYTYDPRLDFEKQIVKDELYTYKLGVNYNFYREGYSPKQICRMKAGTVTDIKLQGKWLINAGVLLHKDNNTILFKTTEITQTYTKKNTAGDSSQVVTKKINAYTDSIYTSKVFTISGNVYWVNPTGKFALHFFPGIDYYIGTGTSVNAGLGILLSFKNQKKEQPNVNMEFYFQATDLFNTLNRKATPFGASQIGLRMSHPFNFFN